MPIIPLSCFNYMSLVPEHAPNEIVITAIIDVFQKAGFSEITYHPDTRGLSPTHPDPPFFVSACTLKFRNPAKKINAFLKWYVCETLLLSFGFEKDDKYVAWIEYKGRSKHYWEGDFKEVYRPNPDFVSLYVAFNHLNTTMSKLDETTK